MPGRTKRFKFGNAEERSAESFIMLPQKIHGQDTSLGIYTLDVPGVPILLGIRTMKKLGALIDVSAPSLVFTKVFPGVHIPLTRGKNGHLTGMQSHDVHVLEDYASESSRESDQEVAHAQTSAPCEQPLDDLQQLSIADRAHSSSASQLLTVSHGDVPRSLEPKDFHREISRDQQDDCGGSGSRGQEAEQDGPDQVRLGSCGVCQHSRPQVHRSSMLGKSFSRGLRKRQSLGQQRPCGVDRVQSVSPSPSVLPHVVSQGNLSQCWSNHRGCEEQVVEGPRTFTQRTDHSSLGDRSSRGLSRAPLGHPSCSESQDESQGHGEQGGREGDQEGLCDYRVSGRFSSLCQDATSAKEIGEERERSSPRDSGGERRREVMETSVKIPGTSNHDEPSLDDDALILEESTMDSPTCSYMLSESQKEKIAGSLHSAHEELVEILGTLQNDHCALLEVCCAPQSGLTEKIQQLGHIAYRIGLQNNMDLTTEVGYQRASDFGHSVKPNWMWFSVPCGPNSPIQNLNQRTEQQMHTLQKKRKKNKRIINNCIRLAREQIARGGHIGWEWPRENMGWSDPQLKGFFRYLLELGLFHVAMLDGCQVGVVAHDSGEPMKKPWKIVTSCSHMSKVINLRCPGDHVHATCMGHSRAHHSAFYPPRMCSLLSQVMLEHVRTPLRTNVASAVFPVEDTPEEPMSEKELKQMKHVIHQLHVKAGHPPNSALKNMLRARGVDPRMVRLAGEHQCDDCMEVKLPKPHLGVTLHSCDTLWHTMQMDVGQLFYGNLVIHFLLMMDEASRFMVSTELFRHDRQESRNSTTEEVIRAIEQSWVQYHGLPNIIRSDPEGSFRGTAFEEWGAARGVELLPTPGEDHGQIGVVESAIGKVKASARALLRSQDVDPYLGLLQVVSAHNQLDRIGGYAPAQWAYGRLPSLDGRLFEGGNATPYHSSEGTLGTDIRSNLMLRVQAEEVYVGIKQLTKCLAP